MHESYPNSIPVAASVTIVVVRIGPKCTASISNNAIGPIRCTIKSTLPAKKVKNAHMSLPRRVTEGGPDQAALRTRDAIGEPRDWTYAQYHEDVSTVARASTSLALPFVTSAFTTAAVATSAAAIFASSTTSI